jgi:hypothetical protein
MRDGNRVQRDVPKIAHPPKLGNKRGVVRWRMSMVVRWYSGMDLGGAMHRRGRGQEGVRGARAAGHGSSGTRRQRVPPGETRPKHCPCVP